MSKSTLKILPALIVAIIAAWMTQPVFGGAVHQFVFTENSSTNLAITYDESPLTANPFLGPDTWTFELPFNFTTFNSPLVQQWTEPENSSLVNSVDFFDGVITSDRSPNTLYPINADGALVQVGIDGGVPVFATFTDLAGASEVPDTGTTFSLFGLSLTGLGFLRRKLC